MKLSFKVFKRPPFWKYVKKTNNLAKLQPTPHLSYEFVGKIYIHKDKQIENKTFLDKYGQELLLCLSILNHQFNFYILY